MDVLITDPAFFRKLIRRRRESRVDRFDEIWDGVYVVSPLPTDEHQKVCGDIFIAVEMTIGQTGLGEVRFGSPVSDLENKWSQNFRLPDVAAFLPGGPGICKKSHWFGGPDFAVEVISPHDRSRKKFDFYAKVGVKELLLVDRKPWALELYRLQEGVLVLVGKSDLEHPNVLASEVLPLSFRLIETDPRPRIDIAHSDDVQRWSA
jgi:Uma2 family endonuclease